MGLGGPYRVECREQFPHGLGVVSDVSPLGEFGVSTRERFVQARDEGSGLPLWLVDVMDFDPAARDRTFKVKIASAVQPVPPEAIAGSPVRPVVLEGLSVSVYLKEAGRDRRTNEMRWKPAYTVRATGLASPRRSDANKAA